MKISSLSEFYNAIENPLNEKVLNELLDAGEKNQKVNYTQVVGLFGNKTASPHANPDGMNMLDIFNSWREGVLELSENDFNNFTQEKRADYREIQQILKKAPKPSNEKEMKQLMVRNLSNGEKLGKDIDIYDKLINNAKNAASSPGFHWMIPAFGADHRIYINPKYKDVYRLSKEIMKRAAKKGLCIPHKFSPFIDPNGNYGKGREWANRRANRQDRFVIYLTKNNLMDCLKILDEIKRDCPDLVKNCGEPPALAGKLDNWLGVAANPAGKNQSYHSIVGDVVEHAIKVANETGRNRKEKLEILKREIEEGMKAYGFSPEKICFNQGDKEKFMADKPKHQISQELNTEDLRKLIKANPAYEELYIKIKHAISEGQKEFGDGSLVDRDLATKLTKEAIQLGCVGNSNKTIKALENISAFVKLATKKSELPMVPAQKKIAACISEEDIQGIITGEHNEILKVLDKVSPPQLRDKLHAIQNAPKADNTADARESIRNNPEQNAFYIKVKSAIAAGTKELGDCSNVAQKLAVKITENAMNWTFNEEGIEPTPETFENISKFVNSVISKIDKDVLKDYRGEKGMISLQNKIASQLCTSKTNDILLGDPKKINSIANAIANKFGKTL